MNYYRNTTLGHQTRQSTVFEYIKIQTDWLKNAGREDTSETYKQMLVCFMKFRN